MRIPETPPAVTGLLSQLDAPRAAAVLHNLQGPTVGGRYLHWDDLRYRHPPAGLSTEEWWLTLKIARTQGRRDLPFVDTSGRRFWYVLTDELLAMLHRVDRFASGRIVLPEPIANEATRDRYLVSSLMEEAVSSSLLEGAATTRREAKELLRSGRRPRTRAERMVVGNYRLMQLVREDLGTPLSVDTILEIHRTATEGTLPRVEDEGRIQTPGERRVDVGDPFDPDVVLHRPPPAAELPHLLDRLTAFANAGDGEAFVHPVIRAVVLHFMLSYIHPFVDGNGRTARALFYRAMLRDGYWLVEFLSISRLLYRAPTRYARSFLLTETDDADLTYFLLHQVDVLCRAIDDLMDYLEAKAGEIQRVERGLRNHPELNHRQLALLSHALRHPDRVYTIESHRRSHGVVYQTARADLLDLEALGFLVRYRRGRRYEFSPAADLGERIPNR